MSNITLAVLVVAAVVISSEPLFQGPISSSLPCVQLCHNPREELSEPTDDACFTANDDTYKVTNQLQYARLSNEAL